MEDGVGRASWRSSILDPPSSRLPFVLSAKVTGGKPVCEKSEEDDS
jgi:hypothetical protein